MVTHRGLSVFVHAPGHGASRKVYSHVPETQVVYHESVEGVSPAIITCTLKAEAGVQFWLHSWDAREPRHASVLVMAINGIEQRRRVIESSDPKKRIPSWHQIWDVIFKAPDGLESNWKFGHAKTIMVSVLPAYIVRRGNKTLPKDEVKALAGKPHNPGVQTRGHQPQDIEFHDDRRPCVCKSGGRKTRSQCRPYDLKSAGPVEVIFLFNLISSDETDIPAPAVPALMSSPAPRPPPLEDSPVDNAQSPVHLLSEVNDPPLAEHEPSPAQVAPPGPDEESSHASPNHQAAALTPRLLPINNQASVASTAERVSSEDTDDLMDGLTPAENPGNNHQGIPRLPAQYGELRSRVLDEEQKEKEGKYSRLNPLDIYHMLDLRLDHLMEMSRILRAADSLRPDEPTTPNEDYRWSQEIYGVMGRISVTLARLSRCLRDIRSKKSNRSTMTAQMPRIRVGPESGATGRVLAANVTVKKENIVDAAAITVRAKRRREEEIKQLQDEHARVQQIRLLLEKEQDLKERLERKKRKHARAEAANIVID